MSTQTIYTPRDRRETILTIRLSQAEKAAIARAAAQEYRRLSDHVRVLILRALREQRRGDEQRRESPDA